MTTVHKMEISFNIGIDDVMAFHSNHYDTDPAYIKRRWISPILLVFFGFIFYLYDRNWISLVIFGTLAIFLILNNKSRWLKRMRKVFDVPENAIWFGRRTMEFDDERGITTVSDSSNETLSWNAFVRVSETPDYFFLYVSTLQAHIIPKQAMTAAEIGYLTQLLNDKVPYSCKKESKNENSGASRTE